MATIRLIPSTYYLSNSSYLTVSNASNMYTNTDSTTYATIQNTRSSNSSYYIYIRGFNFDDIPSSAIIDSFSIKIKGNYSSGYSQNMYLYDGTTAMSGSSSPLSSSVTTQTFTSVPSWDDIVSAGSDFGIRINCRRSSRNTTAYYYIYGAEIEVEYTIPTPRTITTTLTGSGTINPSGSTTAYDGNEFELIITPTNTADTVTATQDGVDITSSLVAHYAGGSTVNTNLGSYTLVSGSFNGSGASYFSEIVGNGVNASQTTSNYYSGGSGTIAVFTYDMAFTGIPSNAVIERVYCEVNAHAESTSNSNEYMCAMLISGSTELSEEYNWKDSGSTSNSTYTLECDTLPTVSQLANMKLQCRLGYYGGALNGATCYVEYSIPGSGIEYYSYTYIVNGNSTIAVTIGSSSGPTDSAYFKINGAWVQVSQIYKKINGTWVLQTDYSNVFDAGVKYKY